MIELALSAFGFIAGGIGCVIGYEMGAKANRTTVIENKLTLNVDADLVERYLDTLDLIAVPKGCEFKTPRKEGQ